MEQLDRDKKVVRSLLAGKKLSLDQIEKEHPHLKTAAQAIREEEAGQQKAAKPTSSGCSSGPRQRMAHV